MQRSTISMFAQLVQLMGGKIEFHNLVKKYQSDKGAKGLTTWSQFIAMLFCQLTGADSLREISDGLYSSLGKLSHIGATAVCRSTLSYANSKRPYKLYEDFYYVLLEKFRHEIQARTPQAKSYLVVQSINTLLIKQMRTQCLQASISSGRSPVPHSLA